MRRFTLALVLCLGIVQFALAQQSITGVVDDKIGDPLIGATVLVEGTTTGTVTDIDGAFSLTVPEGGTELTISYTGYGAQSVQLTDATEYNVTLSEGVDIDEVVVTALGVSRDEKSLGYSVDQIDGGNLNKAQETSLVSSLSGRVAGAQINNSTSGLGGSSSIILRGATSVTGSNQPLFVVDGTPIDNNSYNSRDSRNASTARSGRDYGNMAQDINPNDIASVSVLKGGAAAALYGSRASNGVILITTKSGQAGKGLGVTVNSGVNVQRVAVFPDYQNEYGGGYGLNFDTLKYNTKDYPASFAEFDGQFLPNYQADESWGPALDGTPVRHWDSWFPGEEYGKLRPWSANPDNIRDFYQTGLQFNNNVSISGGNEQTVFRLSFTNNSQDGVYPGSSQDRNTLSFNASQQIGGKLTASVNANYVNTKGEGRPGIGYGGQGEVVNVQTNYNQWWQRQIDMERLKNNYISSDGSPRSWNINGPTNTSSLFWENPYWVINNDLNSDQRDRIYGNIGLKYDFAPGLSLQGFARTDYYTFTTKNRVATGSTANLAFYEDQSITSREDNFEALLDYSTQLSSQFSFDGQLGGNIRQNSFDQSYGKSEGGLSVGGLYTIGGSVDRPDVFTRQTEKEVQSVYGRVGFGWNSMLYLDVTGRNDWSSTLEDGNNSYFYPSASASFVFSELLPGNTFITFGKLRGGFATVGNDTDPYSTRNTFVNRSPLGNSPAFGVSNTLNELNLTSESITTWEAGLDMRFLNDRVGFDATYYDIRSEDLIIPVEVSSATGFSFVYFNAGLLSNKGLELKLYATPVQTDNFTWNTAINFAKNVNEVVELADGVDRLTLGSSRGATLVAERGRPYGTFFGAAYARDANGELIINPRNSLPTFEANQDLGSAYPDFTGGLINDFTIFGFNLGTVVDFRKGGVISSVTHLFGSYSGQFSSTVGNNDKGNPIRNAVVQNEDGDYLENSGGVRVDGVTLDANGESQPYTGYAKAQNYFKNYLNVPEAFMFDASFIKLREVSLGRALPEAWFANNFVGGARVSLTGRNLAILHKNIPNLDPETALSNSNVQGFENGQNPSVRSVGFDVNLTF